MATGAGVLVMQFCLEVSKFTDRGLLWGPARFPPTTLIAPSKFPKVPFLSILARECKNKEEGYDGNLEPGPKLVLSIYRPGNTTTRKRGMMII